MQSDFWFIPFFDEKLHLLCMLWTALAIIFYPTGTSWDKKHMRRFKNCVFAPVSGVRSGRITHITFPQTFILHQAQQYPKVLLWHYWGGHYFLHHFSGAAAILEYLQDVPCEVLQIHSCLSEFWMQEWLWINYFQVRIIWLETYPSNEVRNSVCSLHCVETLQDILHGLNPVTVPVPPLYSAFSPSLILPREPKNNDGSSGSLPKEVLLDKHPFPR